MTDYLRLIDRDTTGNRCDVTPLFADAQAFSSLLDDLIVKCSAIQFDQVAAIDALGFILGTGISVRTQKGMIVLRKGGKLPVQTDVENFVDYTGNQKSLEIRPDAIKRGTRVLLVDEWIETGAQIRAAISLIEQRGGIVAGIASINIDPETRADFDRRGYKCFSITER
ncbi:MAG TPA: hypothetical protein VHS31_13910 [Tepidisphaeraceae bacterium]|nr:hypothetical protein [Tepidisphaeraceae bacterium]